MCLANIFPKKSDALDPQVLHMMTFKTSMKTSYLVATDVEEDVDNCTNHFRALVASEVFYDNTELRGFVYLLKRL